MGLDMWASKRKVLKNGKPSKTIKEIADRRKHNRLHGWMTELWVDKGCPEENDSQAFNCVPLTLDKDDLLQLKQDILSQALPATQGFFFGHDSYDWSKDELKEADEYDLNFCEKALTAIGEGYKVHYNSWW